MWFWVQIAAYASLVLGYLTLLLLAIRYRPGRGQMQRLLEAALVLAAVWTLSLGLLVVLMPGVWWHYVWHRVAQVGLVVTAALIADLARVFVQQPSRRGLWLAVALVTLGLGVAPDILSGPLLIRLPFLLPIRLEPARLTTLLLTLAWALCMGSAWWTCRAGFLSAAGFKHRNRIRYLSWSLVSSTIGGTLILVGAGLDVHLGLAALLLGFCLITFAGWRHDLPDLKRWVLLVARALSLAVLTAIVYLLALGAVALLAGVLPDVRLVTAAPFLGIALVLAAMVDVGLGPRLRAWLSRKIMGQNYGVRKALGAHSQEISLILDLERLADRTLDWLRMVLQIQRSAFVLLTLREDNQVELRVLKASGVPCPPAYLFGTGSRFIAHFYRHGRPLTQYDLDMLTWFQSMPAGERQWLRDLMLDLYIPILVAGKPVALLALGPKPGGQPYEEDDLEALTILAGQTATALENARLMNDLRIVQDDIRRLGAELAETNHQLARLDQAKSDFIAIASHELRTPLTQIYGYSDVLAGLNREDLTDAGVVKEFVDGISRGARRLKQVVDAIVDVSLIETGSLKIEPEPVSITAVMKKVVEVMQPALKERHLSLTSDGLENLPFVQADSSRLVQVFISLLSNAIKFTPDGGSIVISGCPDSSADGAGVEIRVADTGIGVDPDQQDLIFEKFYRAENPLFHSTSSVGFKGAGPGLGLAIAKGIVLAHGGRIWVESPGRDEKLCPGSTFHLVLPAYVDELE
jgi:signal transduction histidine kinase